MTPLIDVNVYLSRWPFRRLPADDTPALVAKLRDQKVEQAWCGSFDGLLHRDLAAVNARLAEECTQHGAGVLAPFGSVNPAQVDWEEDLRRCHEIHKMPGIRLHPNYHRYTLDQPEVARLLAAAAERGLIVQVALSMEDERTQHPLVQVPHVEPAPLVELLKTLPKLRLVVLNAFRKLRVDQLDKLVTSERMYFELATLEGLGGVTRLLKQVTMERILFGSYAPFFAFESARLKLQESALAGGQIEAIGRGNARRLLGA